MLETLIDAVDKFRREKKERQAQRMNEPEPPPCELCGRHTFVMQRPARLLNFLTEVPLSGEWTHPTVDSEVLVVCCQEKLDMLTQEAGQRAKPPSGIEIAGEQRELFYGIPVELHPLADIS